MPAVVQILDGIGERVLDRGVARCSGRSGCAPRSLASNWVVYKPGRPDDGNRAERLCREAPEQDRAVRVEVVVQVPVAEHRAGGADVDGAARAGHHGRPARPRRSRPGRSRQSSPAYWRFANTMSCSSCRVNGAATARSAELLLDHHETRPRAQRALRPLVADDPVEALERVLGVRQPVAVVRVRDVVPDALLRRMELRHARRTEGRGVDRIRVRPAEERRGPLAGRQRTVEDRQAERRVCGLARLGVAGGPPARSSPSA